MKKTLADRYKELVPEYGKPSHIRQWPVVDKARYCDKCGFMGTYGNGKTWNRCFVDLNKDPKSVIERCGKEDL